MDQSTTLTLQGVAGQVPQPPSVSFESVSRAHAAPPPGSPFDGLRQVREDGSEFWSARALASPFGYPRWADFQDALQRAFVSCENAGEPIQNHFRTVTTLGQTGQQIAPQPRRDCELSRFGAYLLAMNGDPRKDEIARAQMYFAVRTRQAEVAEQPRELSRRELLVMALEAEDRAALWEERAAAERAALAEARPALQAYAQLMNADGTYSLAAAAQACGMGRSGFIAVCAELGLIIVRPGHSDHLRPYQTAIRDGRFRVKLRVFDVVKDGQTETRTEGTTVVTPKGVNYVLRRLAERRAEQDAARTAEREDQAPTRQ